MTTRASCADGGDVCSNDLAGAFEQNARSLWRFILVRVDGDESIAEDLMQELCLQLAGAKLSNVDPNCYSQWLFGLARNVVRRYWRTTARQRRNFPKVRANLAEMIDSAPLPEEILEEREFQRQIMLAVTALTDADQEMILRYYFDNQSQLEIADEMKISIRSVEGRLYRARKMLRCKLAHMDEADGYDL